MAVETSFPSTPLHQKNKGSGGQYQGTLKKALNDLDTGKKTKLEL